MDKAEIITNLGNLIMRGAPCTIEKEDTDILFDTYKLLMDYRQEERRRESENRESGWVRFAKIMEEREAEKEYLKWRDEYVDQLTWFYKYLGLEESHAVGDFLYLGSNETFGYDLRSLYKEIKKDDTYSEQ